MVFSWVPAFVEPSQHFANIYIYYTLNRFVQTVCTGLRLVSDMEGWTVVLSDERRRSFSGHRAQAGEGTTCEILS